MSVKRVRFSLGEMSAGKEFNLYPRKTPGPRAKDDRRGPSVRCRAHADHTRRPGGGGDEEVLLVNQTPGADAQTQEEEEEEDECRNPEFWRRLAFGSEEQRGLMRSLEFDERALARAFGGVLWRSFADAVAAAEMREMELEAEEWGMGPAEEWSVVPETKSKEDAEAENRERMEKEKEKEAGGELDVKKKKARAVVRKVPVAALSAGFSELELEDVVPLEATAFKLQSRTVSKVAVEEEETEQELWVALEQEQVVGSKPPARKRLDAVDKIMLALGMIFVVAFVDVLVQMVMAPNPFNYFMENGVYPMIMCVVWVVGCLEGLSPKKSPGFALSQSARGVRVLVDGKLKPVAGWSKRVLGMIGIALLGVASRAAEVGGPETVAQPIIKNVQAPAANAGMPHSGGAEVQQQAAFGAEEVVAGLLQDQEQVGEIGSEELAVPAELAAEGHEQVHESEAKVKAAEGQVDARLVAKDMENDVLRDMLSEVLEDNAEMVGQMEPLIEEQAGLEGAEVQAGFRERAGFAAAGQGVRGEAAVGGGGQGGGGEKWLVGAEEEGGERAEGRSAAQDGGGGEASVPLARVSAELTGSIDTTNSDDGLITKSAETYTERKLRGDFAGVARRDSEAALHTEGRAGLQNAEAQTSLEEKAAERGKESGWQRQARKLTTYTVETSGVRGAVDGAANGDVILWNKGTNLDQTWSADGMVVDRAITLECTDVISMCTIDAQASSGDNRRALLDTHGTDESSNYIGIKFTRGYTGGGGGGLYIESSTVTMTICEISSNTSLDLNGGGLYIDSSTVTMTSCEISSNTADVVVTYEMNADGGGMYVTDSSTVDVFGTLFSGNTAKRGDDIYRDSGTVTIHSTCPAGYKGSSAAQGGALDTRGTVSGPLFSFSGCTVCPAGGYSASPGSDCVACSAGTYLSDLSTSASLHDEITDCTTCPSGRYNADSGISAVEHSSIATCSECIPGTFLEDDGDDPANHDVSEDCKSCGVGTFAEDSGSSICQQCEGGLSSPPGAVACSFCPAGYECAAGTTTACAAGSYSTGGSSCVPCERGFRCPGASDHIPCSSGSYQDEAAQDECKACPAGKLQAAEGAPSCYECPAGHFCPEGSKTTIECGSAALYCPTHSATVSIASAGKFTTPAMASPTARVSEEPCPVGHACVGGVKFPCTALISFQADVGQASCSLCSTCAVGKLISSNCTTISDTGCTSCEAGKFGDGTNSNCFDCDESGTVSSVGASRCTYCAAGEIPNAAKSSCSACGSGKYSSIGDSSCTECEAGQYSTGERAAKCEFCAPGKYSSAPGAPSCSICSPGHVSSTGDSTCDACSAGKHEDGNTCQSCVAGKFSGSGAASCESECPQGHISPAGAAECEPCEAGTYAAGGMACELCTAGRYSDSTTNECMSCCSGYYSATGATVCVECESGKKSSPDFDSCDLCTTGRYSPGGTDHCDSCAPGHYSSTGAATCAACESGKKSTRALDACENCQAGKFSSSGSSECASNCTAGTYAGLGAATCHACDPGTFSAEGAEACTNCDPGSFSKAQAGDCTLCPTGEVSGAAASSCTACNASIGFTSSSPGQSSCTFCGPGKRADAVMNECEACRPGYFSVGGSAACKACSEGKYAEAGGLSFCETVGAGSEVAWTGELRTSTTLCAAGRYSVGSTDECSQCTDGYSTEGSSNCEKCGTGTYYDAVAMTCSNCPAGRFSTSGAESIDGCDDCQRGFVSEEAGLGFCDPCTPGKRALPDNTTCVACDAGKYSSVAAHECMSCEAGKYAGLPNSYSCETCADNMDTNGTVGNLKCMCKDDFETVGSECKCAPGYMLESGRCVLCAAGFYKSGVSNEACRKCNTEEHNEGVLGSITTDTPATSSLDCTCSKSEFRVLEPPEANTAHYIGQCLTCPDGTDCSGPGIMVESLPLKKGYWRSNSSSHNIVPCYSEEACSHPNRTTTAADFNVDDQCTEGHTGPICNVCKKGYAKSVTGECEECVYESSVPDEMYAFVAIVGVVTATILACVRRSIKKKRRKRKQRLAARDELGGGARQPPATLKKHWIERARTKIKILTSFYQIVSQFESILSVQYPPLFEKFGRFVSKFVNLDALNLAKVGCLVQTSFYHKLVLSTMGPLCVAVMIGLGALVMKKRAKDHAGKQAAIDGAVSLFLGLTYLVFSSVSTTVFDTFNCKTFGDDPREYMMSDQSVDCGTPDHSWYQAYAGAMMIVYPVGIPVLYGVLLWRAREQLQEDGREGNEKLHKIAFLWQDYEPELWWFEVFDCVRRLSLTGLLVFVFKGQASQIVVALVLASLSVVAFVHWRPFVIDSNDNLQIVSQVALFFTLFSALIRKLDVDKTDKYDQATFGVILIFVNSLGVAMVVASQLAKPFTKIFNKLTSKHLHAAPLTGVGEEHADWVEFERYFRRLAVSDERKAGWETMSPKDWGGKKKAMKEWLEETGAVGEWRCANGDGPIDQCRVTFEVEHSLEDVWTYLTTFSKPTGRQLEHNHMNTNKDGSMDVYLAVKMPWPLSPRDFKIQRMDAKGADGAVVMSRSIEDGDAAKKRAARLGRVRGDLRLGGYFLEKSGVAGECTKIVYMLEGHLGGVMNLDMLNKMASGPQLRAVVDNCTVLGEEPEDKEEGRGSSLFAAPRKWLRTISSGAAELGGGVLSREERRRKKEEARRAFEATAPGYAGEPEKPPPPPPGAPPPNNDIFDKLRLQREAAAKAGSVVEIELTDNPLRKEGEAGAEAGVGADVRAVDGRKLQNLDSFNANKIRAKAAKKQQRKGGGGGLGEPPTLQS